MSDYYGNRIEDSTVRMDWGSYDGGTGASITQTGLVAADVLVFKDGSVTQKTTTNGITVSNDFDGRTGLHHIDIDTSNDTGDIGFWVAQADYEVAIDAVTIDSQTVRFWVGHFSIENEAADVRRWLGTAPLALVAQRVNVSVGAMAADVLTASALATDAVQEIVDGLWDELISGHTVFGSFGQYFQQFIFGRVDDVAPTATDFDTDGFVEATAAHLDDVRVVFLTGALAGQGNILSVYGGGALQNMSFDEGYTEAPANNDEFLVIPMTGAKRRTIATQTDGMVQADVLEVLGAAINALIAGRVDANAQVVGDKTGYALTVADKDDITDRVWDELMSGHVTLATFGQVMNALGARTGAVNAGVPTTTSFIADGFTEITDNHFNGMKLVFTSGALTGQGNIITDYTGASQLMIFAEAWTEAPVDDDEFVVLPGILMGGTPNSLAGVLREFIMILNQTTGQLDSGSFQTGAIDAAALAADAVAEIADGVWDEPIAGHVAGGSFGEEVQAHALEATLLALNDLSAAEVNTQMLDVMNVDTIPELAQGVPPALPTHRQAIMAHYMALRNRLDIDTSGATDFKEIYDDAGVVIFKKVLTDDGSTYSEAEAISGP